MQSFFFRTSGQDNVQLFSQQQLDRLNVQLQQVDEDTAHERSTSRHLRNEMETGAENNASRNLFLGSFLGTRRSAMGHFSSLSLATVPSNLTLPSFLLVSKVAKLMVLIASYLSHNTILYNRIFFI